MFRTNDKWSKETMIVKKNWPSLFENGDVLGLGYPSLSSLEDDNRKDERSGKKEKVT